MDLNIIVGLKSRVLNHLSYFSQPQLLEEAFSRTMWRLQDIEADGNPYNLILTTCKNQLVTLIRLETREAKRIEDFRLNQYSQPDAEHYDRLRFLQPYIDLLPPAQKNSLKAYSESLAGGSAVAVQLGIPINTFKANCRHAILKLQYAAKGYSDETGTSSTSIDDFSNRLRPSRKRK